MKTIEVIQKTREYLDYIEEHINNVQKAWNELKVKCKDMAFIWDDYRYFSIQDMVDRHDMSKLSEKEFIQYRKFFYPLKKEQKYDIREAWGNHKKENPHHWENWTKEDFYNPYAQEVHCVHMILDWMAMGYKFGDTAQEYYEKNRDKINIPEEWIDFMYQIFDRVRGNK